MKSWALFLALVPSTYAFIGLLPQHFQTAVVARNSAVVQRASLRLGVGETTRRAGLKLRMADASVARDELIDKLLSAASYDLPSLVSQVCLKIGISSACFVSHRS